jgi:phenylpropionate dioxygenase-like ring-hydroxylating dioxygenase large terminal subunit
MIAKRNYHSPDALEREVERLFNTGFQFVALTTELEKDRNFVCLDRAGAAIVVQNFKGELRAFQNICTHRFNKIQTEDRGNRPLSCRYHGWTFDRTGAPSGLPKREQFTGPSGEIDASLCLPQYPIEVCGKFVFVNMGGGAASLNEHLGDFYETLEEISVHIGAEIHSCTVPHAANWKLLVENVLECYHCATVHRDTFIPLGVGKKPIDQVILSGDHSSSHFPRVDEEREHLRQRYLSHLKSRGFAHNSFYHIYIFPNLFISSGEGLSFYVGNALPVSPAETNLRMRIFEPAVELSEKHRARQDPINAGTIETSLALVEEDRAILEMIQRGIGLSDRPGRIGAEEIRIKAYMERYAHHMEPASSYPRLSSLAGGAKAVAPAGTDR